MAAPAIPQTPPTIKAMTANVTSSGMAGLSDRSMIERVSSKATYADDRIDVTPLAIAPTAKGNRDEKKPATSPGTSGLNEVSTVPRVMFHCEYSGMNLTVASITPTTAIPATTPAITASVSGRSAATNAF